MSQDEQRHFDQLQTQVVAANSEARLYRGLFWLLLSAAAIATLLHVLEK